MFSSRDPTTYTGVDLGDQGILFHSQANQEQFPDNVMSDFRCKLTKSLKLPGAWNIALHSLEYNTNIINVLDGEEEATVKGYYTHLPGSTLTLSLTAFAGMFKNFWWSLKNKASFTIKVPHLMQDENIANQEVADQFNAEFAKIWFPLNKPMMPANTTRFYLKMNLYSDPHEDGEASSLYQHFFTSKQMLYGVLRGRNLIDHILTLLNTAAGVGEYFNPTDGGQRKYLFAFDEAENKITLLVSKHGKVKLDTGRDEDGSLQMITLLGLSSRYSHMANINEDHTPVTHVFHNHPDLRAVDVSCVHLSKVSAEKPFRPSALAVKAQAADLLYPLIHFDHYQPDSENLRERVGINSSDFCKHTSLESVVEFCFPFHTMSLTDQDHLQLLSTEPGEHTTIISSNGESFLQNSLGIPSALGLTFTTSQDIAFTFPQAVDRELLAIVLPETKPLNEILRAQVSQVVVGEEPTINVGVLPVPGPGTYSMAHVTGYSNYNFKVEASSGVDMWLQPAVDSVFTFGCVDPNCIPEADFTTRYMFRKKLKKWTVAAKRALFPQDPQSDTVHFPTNRAVSNLAFANKRNMNITQNKVRLRLGFVRRSDTEQVELVYDQIKALSAPGSYRKFSILSKEISELFRDQLLYGQQTISLDDVLAMRVQEGVFQAQFRLRAHRPADPANQLKINYVEMHFSPHLARMIGLLPANNKDLHSLPRIRVSNMKGLVERNDTTAHPLVGLGPAVTDTVKESITNILRLDTAPHRVNCDLGITDMHIYLPMTIEKMSVGKSTASLLATVPISKKPNARVHYQVINPQKRKLLQEELDEVQVLTLDYAGKRIKFASSINALTLDNRLQKWA